MVFDRGPRKRASAGRTILVFSTRATGSPQQSDAPVDAVQLWPRLVQLAWVRTDGRGAALDASTRIVRPDGFEISAEAAAASGVTTQEALNRGEALPDVLSEFLAVAGRCDLLVAHDMRLHVSVVGAELVRLGIPEGLGEASTYCTMKQTADWARVSPPKADWRWPSLEELYASAVGKRYRFRRDAMGDAEACAACVRVFIRRGVMDVERLAGQTTTASGERDGGPPASSRQPASRKLPVELPAGEHSLVDELEARRDLGSPTQVGADDVRQRRRTEQLEEAQEQAKRPSAAAGRSAPALPEPAPAADENARRALLRRHFDLAKQIQFWYGLRRDDVSAMHRTVVLCEQQIAIAPQVFPAVVAEFGRTLPHTGYHHLSVIRESQGDIVGALRLARAAQAQGWLDLSGDWSARISRLEKRVAKSQRRHG